MPTSRRVIIGMAAYLGFAVSSGAVPCTVPSGSHPTIQAAVADLGCSEINLLSQLYQENPTIERSLAVSGVTSSTTVIVGQIRISGTGSVVTLAELTVNASDSSVAGCFGEAVVSNDGAQVIGSNILVFNATGAACTLFADGFESGNTLAWSLTTP